MSRLSQLQQLLASDPGDAELMYMIAQEHAKARAWEQAIAWYERCLGASADHFYAYFHKARAHQGAGDAASALGAAREGLARARRAGDAKAASELGALVDELED